MKVEEVLIKSQLALCNLVFEAVDVADAVTKVKYHWPSLLPLSILFKMSKKAREYNDNYIQSYASGEATKLGLLLARSDEMIESGMGDHTMVLRPDEEFVLDKWK